MWTIEEKKLVTSHLVDWITASIGSLPLRELYALSHGQVICSSILWEKWMSLIHWLFAWL